MIDPLRIAIVGHTNAGKTSLLRTLTRQVDFGEVSDRPGTTRHVEAVDLRIEDAQGASRTAVRFFDTPGLEDGVALLAHVAALEGDTRPARIRSFLAGPEAHGVFEQEAKVLRQLLDADAAFLVIDTRAPVLPKYRDEAELLGACARPLLPVLNFVRDAASREADWRAMLSEAGLHAIVRFDAAAPFTGSEQALYRDLATLLPGRRETLDAIAAHLQREFDARRAAACRVVAAALVEGAALRRSVDAAAQTVDQAAVPPPAAGAALPAAATREVQALRQQLHQRAQRAVDALLALHGFREGDAAEAPLPQLQGRQAMDLFNPETLRQAGRLLSRGAAMGAAIGVAADVAAGGLSLGAGTALGGAIGGVLGGALAQGWGPLGRRLANRLRGVQELSVEDSVLYVLADWLLRLLLALEQRGHGAAAPASAPANTAAALPPDATRALVQALRAAQPARGHAEWAETGTRAATGEAQACIEAVARHIGEAALHSATQAPALSQP